MNDVKRIAAVVTAALAVPLTLAGCATDPARVGSSVAEAVSAADPAIRDVYVSTGSGPAGTSVRVRLYVAPRTDDLAGVIDAALRATLLGAPERPASFTLDVAEGAKPGEVNLNLGAVPLEDPAAELGLENALSDDMISGPTDLLEDRYGTWSELHT